MYPEIGYALIVWYIVAAIVIAVVNRFWPRTTQDEDVNDPAMENLMTWLMSPVIVILCVVLCIGYLLSGRKRHM